MLICFIVPSLVSFPNMGGQTDGAMVRMYVKRKPSIRATQEPAETSAGAN